MEFIKKTFFSSYPRVAGFLAVIMLLLSIPISLSLVKQKQNLNQQAHAQTAYCPGACGSSSYPQGQGCIVSSTGYYGTWQWNGVDAGSGQVYSNCPTPNTYCYVCISAVTPTPTPFFIPTPTPITGLPCGITTCNSTSQTCLIDGITGVATCAPLGTTYMCRGNPQNVPCGTTGPTPTPIPTQPPQNTCPTTPANPVFSVCSGSTVVCSWASATGIAWYGEIYSVINGVRSTIVCSTSWGNGQIGSCNVSINSKTLTYTGAATNMQYGCTIGSTCMVNTSSAKTCTLGTVSGPTATPLPSVAFTPTPAQATPTPTSRLACDPLTDGKINIQDYSEFVSQFLGSKPTGTADCDKSGKVDIVDYSILIKEFLDPAIPH